MEISNLWTRDNLNPPPLPTLFKTSLHISTNFSHSLCVHCFVVVMYFEYMLFSMCNVTNQLRWNQHTFQRKEYSQHPQLSTSVHEPLTNSLEIQIQDYWNDIQICQGLDTVSTRQSCSKIYYKCDYFDFPIISYRTFVNRGLLTCKITESRLPKTAIWSLKKQIQKCMVIIVN